MTPTQFIIWLKGFVQAANGYNITPKQWDDLKEKLAQVNDKDNVVLSRYTLETNSTSTSDKVLLTDNKVL